MPPFFLKDFVSPSMAVALVGSSLHGKQWNGCPTLSKADRLNSAVAALREVRTIARQRELWPALRASNRLISRRARVLELDAEMAAKWFVSLDDADKKAIDDEIAAKFAEELARKRRCWQAKCRLLELLCSAQITATLLMSSGNRYEVPWEYWASDQAGSAVDSGEASYNLATYKSGPSTALQGRVLVPKTDLIAALEGSTKVSDTRSKGGKKSVFAAKGTNEINKKRKQSKEHEALLRCKISTVLTVAKRKWPDKTKRPLIAAMAKELARGRGEPTKYSSQTIRKILAGTYPASQRLGIGAF